MKINKISILGLGYIGLPLAVMLADKSCKIYGFDKAFFSGLTSNSCSIFSGSRT